MVRHIPKVFVLSILVACGGSQPSEQRRPRGGEPGRGGGSENVSMAVPIEIAPVQRSSIAQHLETSGVLEAEHDVDIVARTGGPIVELLVEEGDSVRRGALLARIDDREASNQVAIATVSRDEAALEFKRSLRSHESGLVSQELHDAAVSNLNSAEAQLQTAELLLSYTEIRAPFDAQVVVRHVKNAQYVGAGTALFRVADFDPLLCAIEIPERDLPHLRKGQAARVEVAAYADEAFSARVLRIRPTVEADTGTITVTLEVEAGGKLRPGMFASVHLEVARHDGVVVIPRDALVLDAIGDTVFVDDGGTAMRREIELGFREADRVEVLEGLAVGESLIVLGQDGLADGTPVEVLGEPVESTEGRDPPRHAPDAEREQRIRERMKADGLSDEEIEERLRHMREGGGRMGPPPEDGRSPRGGPPPGGGLPPRMVERIKDASDEDLERIRERMKSFGMSDDKIERTIRGIRSGDGE